MKYRAFLSYSRVDDRQANWLHVQLESYRAPKGLVLSASAAPEATKLYPIFRDRTDMSGGGQLSARIVEALTDSEALIVLCSPAAALSSWVNLEVETFIALQRIDRIFPVIVSNAPESDDVERDFFPPALRNLGLVAADLRSIKREEGHVVGDGRERGRVKLIAGLLGAPLDDLLARERVRKRMRAFAFAGGALAGVALIALAAGFRYAALRSESAAAIAQARIFAERSWDANTRGNRFLAARYALAGSQRAPIHESDFRSSLARVMHDSNDTLLILEHGAAVTSAVFSADGALVATSGEDDAAKIWARSSGELLRTLRGHDDDVLSVAFSRDSARVVTASKDGTARVWDVRTGRGLLVLQGHTRAVVSALFSPDGDTVVTASDDSSARIWDARTGHNIAVLSHEGAVGDVGFSPDGASVLTASLDGTARIWSVSSGRETANLGFLHASPLVVARYSPDGRRVVMGRWDRRAVVRNVDGSGLAAIDGHPGFVTGAAFSPDNSELVTLSWGGAAFLTSFATGQTAALEQHDESLTHAAFSPDGASIIAASAAGGHIWEAASGRSLANLFGHSGEVTSIVYSPDGSQLLTGSRDGAARLWRSRGRSIGALTETEVRNSASAPEVIRARTCPRRPSLFGSDEPALEVIAESNDASQMIVTIGANTRLWEPESRRSRPIGTDENCSIVMAAAFSADRTRVALAWDNGAIGIHDAHDGNVVTALRVEANRVRRLAFTSDGRRLSVTPDVGSSITFDTASGRRLSGAPQSGTLVDANEQGRRRAIVVREAATYLWNVEEDAAVVELVSGYSDWRPSFSNDGARVLAPGDENSVRVLRADTGGLLANLRGHQSTIQSAMFSQDGTRVVTSSLDGTARIWDAQTGREMASFVGNGRAYTRAYFSDDDRRLVAISMNRTIRVWDVERLTQSMQRLSTDACALLLRGANRQFSATDIAADPLIEEVWLRDGRGEVDVCA